MQLRLARVPSFLLFAGIAMLIHAGVASSAQRPQVAPPTVFFYPVPPIVQGQDARLTWNTLNATAVSIDQGVGPQALNGFALVHPTVDTDYTLTATGPGGSTSATQRVTVLPPPPGAHVVVSALPQPLVLLPGTKGSTSFTLANNGGQSTLVNLAAQGGFFSVGFSSFSLSPGGSQTVSITTNVLQPTTYQGAVVVTVQSDSSMLSIPVQALVVPPPSGPTSVTTAENRVDLAVGPETTTVTGSTSFTNTSQQPLTALVTSDVPWMTPDKNVVTIGPGQTVVIGFTIDRTKRPDSGALQGSARCGLILTYLSGSATAGAQRVRPLDGPTPTVSITTVAIVDTVKPGTKAGSPPTLAPGEIAIVFAGAGHVKKGGTNFVSDLAIINGTGTRDLKGLTLFHLPVGGAPSSSNVSNVAAAGSITLVDVTKNVFDNQTAASSLQIRGTEVANISALANLVSLGNPAGLATAALPPFRSDRAAAPGQTILLNGLAQNGTAVQTEMSLQEMTGAAATGRVDYYDATGSAVGSATVNVPAFGLQALPTAPPATAASAIVTNDSSSTGWLQAEAFRTDSRSGDGWTLIDWRRQNNFAGTGAVLIPVAGSTAGLNGTFFKTDVWITNAGATPGGGTLQFYPGGGAGGTIRSKRVPLGGHETAILPDVTSVFLEIPDDSFGYLLFTPDSGTNAAVCARTYTNNANGGAYSSAVPVVGVASALRSGQSRRFGAIDDASPLNVAKGAPATARTNLGFVEASGGTATVKVSLFYDEVQSTFSARKVGELTFSIGPRESIFLRGVSTQLVGKSRATLGDLRNMQLVVEVLTGPGTVVPFTSTVDNGTGDAIVRTE